MGTPLGPPQVPQATGRPAPGGSVVAPGPVTGAPGHGRGGQVRRWAPLAVLVAAALTAGGLVGGFLTGRDGRSDEPGATAASGPEAPAALAATSAVDLDVRVTYCSAGEISGWAQGMAVNHGTEVVAARITVTFGYDDGTVLGEARAQVVGLAPGEAVNWRAGSGPPGDFDSCAVTAVEPA